MSMMYKSISIVIYIYCKRLGKRTEDCGVDNVHTSEMRVHDGDPVWASFRGFCVVFKMQLVLNCCWN